MKESRKIQSKKRNVNGKSLAKKLFLGMVMFFLLRKMHHQPYIRFDIRVPSGYVLGFLHSFLRACFKDLWFIDGTHFRARSNCSKHA
jgi:hypothetical protein